MEFAKQDGKGTLYVSRKKILFKPYEFLPHTADTRIRAYGKTLEEAFINCALATTDTITNHTKIKAAVERKIKIKSENKESLLYDFLEQFLILLDSEGFLLHKVKELKIKDLQLTATVSGDTHPEKYKGKPGLPARRAVATCRDDERLVRKFQATRGRYVAV